ncbi:glutaredoxin family protein [uncultured Microbacterium sp.]|uniref:glutaredoxin family protein n=1 Tax=uncultured Microbacterium sp. TaxID=191216 RepID=UPI002607926D|nr:glutaredoxin family protein [uncultured Microbacterium sp.]
MATLTIITKPDCHLCDVAREIVELVVADLPDDAVEIEELSILDDNALYEQWWEKIPVVLIDDRLHAHWRLSADRLRTALTAATAVTAVTEEEIA